MSQSAHETFFKDRPPSAALSELAVISSGTVVYLNPGGTGVDYDTHSRSVSTLKIVEASKADWGPVSS